MVERICEFYETIHMYVHSYAHTVGMALDGFSSASHKAQPE